jgi:hypothetical protein
VPTQIFAMLRNSISPEINALGTVMIVLTVGLPLLGAAIARNSPQEAVGKPPAKPEPDMENSDGRYQTLRATAERYQNGDASRANFLGLIGAAGLPMACRRRSRAGAGAGDVSQVRFDGWGGVVSEAFRKYAFDPYTAKTGVEGCRRHLRRRRRVSRAVKASQPGEYNIAHLSGVFDYARYTSLGLSQAN